MFLTGPDLFDEHPCVPFYVQDDPEILWIFSKYVVYFTFRQSWAVLSSGHDVFFAQTLDFLTTSIAVNLKWWIIRKTVSFLMVAEQCFSCWWLLWLA